MLTMFLEQLTKMMMKMMMMMKTGIWKLNQLLPSV